MTIQVKTLMWNRRDWGYHGCTAIHLKGVCPEGGTAYNLSRVADHRWQDPHGFFTGRTLSEAKSRCQRDHNKNVLALLVPVKKARKR